MSLSTRRSAAALFIVLAAHNKTGGTEGDRKTMETELRDKSLPQGEVIKPVSGHLYFPVSIGKKVSYELEYSSNGAERKTSAPNPKRVAIVLSRHGHLARA